MSSRECMVLVFSKVFHQIPVKKEVSIFIKINGTELLHMKGTDNQMPN